MTTVETGVPTLMGDEAIAGAAGVDPAKVLFIGLGQSSIAWYRCFLPALHMGADWVGIAGVPPEKVHYLTGLVKGKTQMPALDSYDVIVMQQPRGRGWLKIIRGLQERGVKVIFEVDDYLHAIRKMPDHDYGQHFDKAGLAELEMNMRAADALICSTEYIGRRYRSFNPRVHVCENGVDVARYNLTRPERQNTNIGWAGATGHANSMLPWLTQVAHVMLERPDTHFVSIGQDFASSFNEAFPGRSTSIPFTLVDSYPAAMTMFDVALAPAGRNNFFRGKSDLRWLEAGALGVPIVADPVVYPKITHGVDGFHAHSPEEMRELVLDLVADPDLRTEVGENARRYVVSKRDMRIAVRQWLDVFVEVLELPATSEAGRSGL